MLSNGWWFVRINCCAGTAIAQHRVTPYYKAPKNDKTVAVIREPLQRLYNNWLDPQWQAMYPTLDGLVDHIDTIETWEGHIRPQHHSLVPMPSRLVNFADVKREFLGLPLREPIDTPLLDVEQFFSPRMLGIVHRVYEKDFEIWAGL